MQLMINAHKEPYGEKQEDKEHDKDFKEVYKGVAKRGRLSTGSLNLLTVYQETRNLYGYLSWPFLFLSFLKFYQIFDVSHKNYWAPFIPLVYPCRFNNGGDLGSGVVVFHCWV